MTENEILLSHLMQSVQSELRSVQSRQSSADDVIRCSICTRCNAQRPVVTFPRWRKSCQLVKTVGRTSP